MTITVQSPAWRGHLEWVAEGEYWRPWRLPSARIGTAHSPSLTAGASGANGIRAELRTDATELELDIVPLSDQSAPVDILVDDQLHFRTMLATDSNRISTALPAGAKRVSVWLPQAGQVAVGALRVSGGTFVEPAPTDTPQWITYGSSITQCGAAFGPSETWPAIVARSNDWQLRSLGFGGDCHLDPIVARTIRDAPADLISLCLGINIYGRGSFAERSLGSHISGFIETVREGHPHTPIAVISPIASPDREDTPNLVELTLNNIRQILTDAVELLIDLGDDNLHFIDGRTILSDSEAHLLADGLHPNADGYRLMGRRLAPALHKALSG